MNRFETLVEGHHSLEYPIVAHTLGQLFYLVNAGAPVSMMLIDAMNRDAYRFGKPYITLVLSPLSARHGGQAMLPYGGQWFMIIRNENHYPIRVETELQFFPTSPTPSGIFSGSFG
jgi:hypothetical protein